LVFDLSDADAIYLAERLLELGGLDVLSRSVKQFECRKGKK